MRILQANDPCSGLLLLQAAPSGHDLCRPCWASGGFHQAEAVRTEIHCLLHELFTTHPAGPSEERQASSQGVCPVRPTRLLVPWWGARPPLLETSLRHPSAFPDRTGRPRGWGRPIDVDGLETSHAFSASPASNLRPKQPGFLFRFCSNPVPKLRHSNRPPFFRWAGLNFRWQIQMGLSSVDQAVDLLG